MEAESAHSSNSKLQCRMYEAKFPEIDELVMVNVRQIADLGAYVHLMEYNNIEGMILLSELSRRRIRSIQKLIRVGRNEVVVVLRVDEEKGYIDLSKRRVSAEEIQKCEERFNKSKAVHSIMRHVAEKLDLVLEDLYIQFGWPLYKKFGHAYDAFKLALTEPARVFEGLEISNEVKEELIQNIQRRLTPQAVKIRADIEVTCFSYDGIDGVIAALKAAEAESTEDIEIKVKLVAAPLYVIITQSFNKALGIEVMERALQKMEAKSKEHGGNVVVKMKPRVVGVQDDAELQDMIRTAENQSQQVDGDDSPDEFDE